jgi:hypothetical protein
MVKKFTSKLTRKRIIAITLAVVMIISSIFIFPIRRGEGLPIPYEVFASERTFDIEGTLRGTDFAFTFLIDDVLYGQTSRNGYILAPALVTQTGIDTISPFVLRITEEAATDYSEAVPLISIDGQAPPIITREANDTFIITPAIPLTSNSVYTFRIARENQADITWAFQTTQRFAITSTLPRNQATNVPVRTGIEITFSHDDNAPDIKNNFNIYPHAEGEFLQRGSVAIFVPSEPLAHGQIYTVTISAGISLPDSSEVITTDYIFSFETVPELGTQTTNRWSSSIHFPGRIVEFPTFAEPSVNFWLSYNRDRARPAITMNVYRINGRQQAIEAIKKLAETPHWSHFANDDRLIDTSNLTRVSSTRITTSQNNSDNWWMAETFTFPNNLSAGFYVLDAATDDSRSQIIVQITDLTTQIIADDNKALVWVNDMQTGRPAAGAKVFDPISNRTFETSSYGIAVAERAVSSGEYLIITAADGKETVLFVNSSAFQHFYQSMNDWGWNDWDVMPMPTTRSAGWGGWNPWGSGHNANNQYWTALQLDRTLFQRSDTLSLWGFVQNRRNSDENITHVTAVLTENSWWWRSWVGDNTRDILHTQNIPVFEGAYSGEIKLPHLDPGNYQLEIFHGDIVLSSTFFSVMDYVKPPYQLTVEADKKAIFAGEHVTFTAKTEFFEGTPVPDLSISYSLWGWELRTQVFGAHNNSGNNFGNHHGGQMRTNINGVVEITAAPTAENSTTQGERNLGFSAEATLPEIGWVYESANVRVFVNDINVRPRATRDGRDATLTVNVHNITLDRLNNGTSEHWGDFLDTPRANQRIQVEIQEVYWERVAEGRRYDHILRQNVNIYRHVRRERSLQSFEIITNAEGIATSDFTVPDIEKRSYKANITTTDGNGRTITHNVFIGRDWTGFFGNADADRLFLDGVNSQGYDIGDNAELTIMRGTEAVTQGNFLFVMVQNGILSYHIGTNPLSFEFSERHVPNTQVYAWHFNGHTYSNGGPMSARLRYNPENRLLTINIETNEESYKPGDKATVTITTTDANGNPKAANVNISLVDEALFALMDYSVDTLGMLYGNINDNLRFSMATHRTFSSDGIDDAGAWGGVGLMAESATDMAMPAPAAARSTMAANDSAGGGAETRIRERFEDTAVFVSLRTNEQGVATFTFELPDNITSWRVTASGISDDLYAGNAVENVNVTQPMFLHYTLNNVFLVGDTPYIGVNAYGTSLKGGEQVTFEVWREEAPQDIRRASGVSFERVNIPLWQKMEEGYGSIIIRVSVAGYSDAIRHSYQVVNSHRGVDTAIFYETVTPSTVFEINQGGLTNITFTDQGRGQFLRDLMSLRHTWHSGARIEGLIARREANKLIQAHFPDVTLFGEAGNFDVADYQTESGGIAVLPYSDAELKTTVMLIPFIRDEVNLVTLSRYLRNAYSGGNTNNRMLALYGLAMLGEPVLLDLQRHAAMPELSIINTTYVALGLAALGETHVARELYQTRIAPSIQRLEPFYRVNAGGARADILEATSIVALLAAKLGMPESLGLHNYAATHRFDDTRSRFESDIALFLNIERLAFISNEINNHTNAAASITYRLFGETVTRDLGHGGQFTLKIPTQNMNQFSLLSTTGQVGAVSVVRTPLENMQTVENDITISRQFLRPNGSASTTFEQGDLVRVQITVNYSVRSLSGTYVITDFLPSGLVYVTNSARFDSRTHNTGWHAWAATEGQRVTFFDHNGRFDRNHTYYYYARVINPGTFKAEGTLLQSLNAREYMVIGQDTVLTINP